MRKLQMLVFIAIVFCSYGCFFNFETVEGMPDYDAAKAFSDKVVLQVIAEKDDELYLEMDDVFRKTYSADVIPTTLDKVFSYFGKPLEAEYKTDEALTWQYPDGSKKLARKFWYKVRTTTAEKGKYFLQVSVAKNGDKMACLSFSILEFPAGPPDNLR